MSGVNLIPSVELRERLLSSANTVSKAKGTILFRRGDAPVGVYLVQSGKVSLSLEADNRTVPPRVLSEGCLAGLPATVSGNPYSLTAEVTKDADLAFVSREAVLDILRSDAALCFQVMEMLSGEISLIRAAFKTAEPNRRRA